VRKFLLKDAEKHFTGVALELTPSADFKLEDEIKRLKFREFWDRSTGMKKGLIQLLLLSLLLEIFGVSMPFYSQLIIDDVLVTGDKDLLKILAIRIRCWIGSLSSGQIGTRAGHLASMGED